MQTKRIHIILLMAAVLCLSAQAAHAASGDSLFLSVEQLFARGMEQNLHLAADRLAERTAADRRLAARTGRLPEITVGLNGGYVGQPILFQRGLSDPHVPKRPTGHRTMC